MGERLQNLLDKPSVGLILIFMGIIFTAAFITVREGMKKDNFKRNKK